MRHLLVFVRLRLGDSQKEVSLQTQLRQEWGDWCLKSKYSQTSRASSAFKLLLHRGFSFEGEDPLHNLGKY